MVARCAHHWAFLNRAGYAQVEQGATLVRFEERIADPAQFSAWVCETLGIDTRVNSDHLARWSNPLQNSNYAQFVEARTSRDYSRPDHRVRVSRWRERI